MNTYQLTVQHTLKNILNYMVYMHCTQMGKRVHPHLCLFDTSALIGFKKLNFFIKQDSLDTALRLFSLSWEKVYTFIIYKQTKKQ